MAPVMIFFRHRHKCPPSSPPYSSFYLPVALALQAPHTCPTTHTHPHIHTMVRPPIKSKVVCFYWSFALTSGLSFWRLYLSASSWKLSVDNAQCFQLGENQTPGVLAIFPPPPPPEPTFPPSFPPQPRSTILRRLLLLPFTLLPPAGEGGLPPLQITHTKRRWWRRWRSELPVQGPVSINETMKVYFARMHVLNSFLCDSWLGNVSVNLIKDSAGSHYFLSTPVPDGVKVHHLHPWLVQGEAPARRQTSFCLFLPPWKVYICLFVERSHLFFFFFKKKYKYPLGKTSATRRSKTKEVPKFIQRRHTFFFYKTDRGIRLTHLLKWIRKKKTKKTRFDPTPKQNPSKLTRPSRRY